jgi:multiple sugar transport system substrate-binding protein
MKAWVWLRTASIVLGLLLIGATVVVAAPTTVTFGFAWTSGSFMQGFHNVVNLFNQANPDVQIEIVPGMNTEKYLVAVAGGAAPDIYSIGDGEIRDAILDGLALNISDLLQKGNVKSTDFIPPAWQRVVWLGKVWGLPYTADPNFALFSNTQHLNETGLVPPTTIDELNQANMKLTKYTSAGALARIGMNPWDGIGGYVNAYMTWAWAFGGSFFDEVAEKVTPAHPQNVAALEWIKESTLRIPYADVIAAFPGSVLNRFANGNITMFPSNPPQVNNLRNMNKSLDITVSVLPH